MMRLHAAPAHADTLSDDLDQQISNDTPTVRAKVTPSMDFIEDEDEVAKVCKACMESAPSGAEVCPECGGKLVSFRKMPDEYLDQTVGGKYEIEEKIGQGGMGVVYLAINHELHQRVAVKFLSKKLADDENLVLRFLNEAKSYCRVNHPNAVTLLEYGQHDDGTLYIITEFIDGKNVTETLKQRGPLDPDVVLHVGIQIAEVLSAAHHQGVIHRDLKPDNIMLIPSPRGRLAVKVLDFGIAKIVDEEDGPNTETGSVFGTPEFMSPEQARGDDADPRSDIYALGVILFYMISGRLPFRGKNKLVVLNKQLNEDPPRPSELREDVDIPPRLEAVIMKCLNKGRSQRYASADDLLEALEDLRVPGGHNTAKLGAAEKATTEELRASTVRLGERFETDEQEEEAAFADTLASHLDHDSGDAVFESIELSRELGADTSRVQTDSEGGRHIIGLVAGAVLVIAVGLGIALSGGDEAGELDLGGVVIAGHTTAMLENIETMVADGSLDAAGTSLETTRDWVGDDALSEEARSKREELHDTIESLVASRQQFERQVEAGECPAALATVEEVASKSAGLADRLRHRLEECGEPAKERPTEPTEPTEPVAKVKAPVAKPAPTRPVKNPQPTATEPVEAAEKPTEQPAQTGSSDTVEPDPPQLEDEPSGDSAEGDEEQQAKENAGEELPDGMALPPRTIDGE